MLEPDILPDPPPVPPVPPTPDPPTVETRSVTCEFCKSKLDKKGRILERGAKVREMMDAEDVIADLRKQLAKEKEAHETTRGELQRTAAELSPFKSRKFGHLVK